MHQDVLAFWSKVKPNGVLAGHDFNHHRNWAGILEKRLAYARSAAGSKRSKRIPPSYGVGQALSRSLTLSLTLTPTPTPILTALLRIGAGVGRALLPLRIPRQLRRVVGSYAETSRPEASANAPPSTPRPRQIELGAASSRGQPPPIGRCIHWLATPAFFFHIGGSRSARARPARSRSRTTARSHCGLRRVGRRPKVKARGDGNGKEFNCEPRGVPRPAAHSSAVAQYSCRHSRRSNLQSTTIHKVSFISRILPYISLLSFMTYL